MVQKAAIKKTDEFRPCLSNCFVMMGLKTKGGSQNIIVYWMPPHFIF
jgi:hypothetical protein